MNKITVILLAIIIGATACTSQQYVISAVNQPEQKWKFRRLMAFTADEGATITGRMTAFSPYRLPYGHIDVAAYSASGDLIAEKTTYYTPLTLTRKAKRNGGVRFYTLLKGEMTRDSVIKVAFHRNQADQKLNLSHVNIAL